MNEGLVRWAAIAYTANFLAGVVTAIRGGFPAEPLGIRTRLPIAVDAIVGNGSALSAPPAMIVLMWRLLKGSSQSRQANGRLVLLTSTFLAGAVAEPLSHLVLSKGLPKESFASRLGNDLDLEDLRRELRSTAVEVMQPESASVWLR